VNLKKKERKIEEKMEKNVLNLTLMGHVTADEK